MTEASPALRDVLPPGEEIRWHAQAPLSDGIGVSIGISLFGLIWTLLIVAADPEARMLLNDTPVQDPLTRQVIWIQFMIVGFAMMLALPFHVIAAPRMRYVVTDRRVLELIRLRGLGRVHSNLPSRIWGTVPSDPSDTPRQEAIRILRHAPHHKGPGRADWITEFPAMRGSPGAVAAIRTLVAAPKPLIGHQHILMRVPERLRAAFATRLRPDERLLWAAQPDPIRYARSILIGSVLILAFLAPFFLLMRATGAFDIITIGFGAWCLLAPAMAWFRASWTGFGITTQRVIVLDHTPLLGRETTWPLAAIESVSRPWPQKQGGSLTLRDGQRLDMKHNPATLVLRALPDIAAAEVALFVALDGLAQPATALEDT
ncbi:hypothetical protein ACVFYP_13095 [Roseomonas sp. F4]